jgi:hypothetical protein
VGRKRSQAKILHMKRDVTRAKTEIWNDGHCMSLLGQFMFAVL